ncbi:replication-relaxation family protein [Spongiactinospora sp. TRM90649]|uniref:replication-relaxation family protein n=1 Tax=Spongiactinospora sp. TRM90649 TaxID=3031114 RepID=UPI0023F8DF80|nr:replication-relaxation family protein [Spongiactinospora sp. TRM90649]MDF5758797.1 replication-relaxation family protein [Spongiactinospora sp. TRM90649]
MTPNRQPRFDRAALAELSGRLTPRDYDILAHLHQHRVLTTHQIQRIFFTLPQPTRRRLRTLHLLNAVTRFRPWVPYGGGSAPSHWVLGRAGAAVLAIKQGGTLSDLGYSPDSSLAICLSTRLGHQVGVNDFFTELHHHARTGASGARVLAWWSERRCAKLWGDLARPDAYGRWAEGGREVDFFLEHDTGSEPLAKVAGKLADYAGLAEATHIVTPVLLWLPSAAREAHLRELIAGAEVPVATAVQTTLGGGPAGRVWLPADSRGDRLALAELADAWPHLTPPSARHSR